MLKVWGRESSSNVQALMWCIAELELPYDRLDAGLMYGVVSTPEYLKMNPNGTVPTLQDGENEPIWETSAILRYLSNRYGSEQFWPKDPVLSTHLDKWAEWAKLNIALKFTAPVFWRVVRTPPSKRDEPAIRDAVSVLNQFLEIAEVRLSEFPYLAGEHFSMADIQFGHCLFRYFDIDIERADHPCLQQYYDGLTRREPYQKHVMVSYEELREWD